MGAIRCPICGGTGEVDGSFYNRSGVSATDDCIPVPCKACYGRGIIITPDR